MTYTVIYKISGTEQYSWKRCLPVVTHAEAWVQKNSIERGGREALVYNTSELDAIGMPDDWQEAADRFATAMFPQG